MSNKTNKNQELSEGTVLKKCDLCKEEFITFDFADDNYICNGCKEAQEEIEEETK